MRVAVLIVSDRASVDANVDKSGPAIMRWFGENFHEATVVERLIVPDDIPSIQSTIQSWCSLGNVDLILSSGGTGLTPRDVTPEAILPLLDKVASGLQIAMVTRSLSYTPLAMLSRPIAGIRQNTLIITLPGSVKACLEYLGILQPALLHAVQLVRGQNTYQHPTLVTANDATTNISKSQPSNEEGGSHLERRHSFPPEVSVETAPATLPRRHASMRDSQINHSCPHHSASSVAQRHRSSPYRMFSVAEAEKVITSHCPLGVVERIAVDEHAAMRILAEDIYAPRNVPCVPVSLVDGYAMATSMGRGVFEVVSAVTAGDLVSVAISPENRRIIRITTGAPIPPGADTVVMVEDTKLESTDDSGQEERQVAILTEVNVGANIRPVGSDIEQGTLLLPRGTQLSPIGGEIGLLASAGIVEIPVYQLPKVAIFSTGNEIQDISTSSAMDPSVVWDANRPSIKAALKNVATILDYGIVKDNPGTLADTFMRALEEADVIISTGGVSMGEKDYIKPILSQLGAKIHFGRVRMKPGKPSTFATKTNSITGQDQLIFALPGNPVSALVCSHLFVVPALKRLGGHPSPFSPTWRVQIDETVHLDWERQEYHRAILAMEPDNGGLVRVVARSTGRQQSSRMRSFERAQALLVLPAGKDIGSKMLLPGSMVDAMILDTNM